MSGCVGGFRTRSIRVPRHTPNGTVQIEVETSIMAGESRIKSIERVTNRSWDQWLEFMDGIDAKSLDHHNIALKVHDELCGSGIDSLGWWTQAVAVAYEQYIGRRIPGQRPDGTFQTSVSRSTKLEMKELMDRWVDFVANDQSVRELLAGHPRMSGTEKRITWRAKAVDGSNVIVTSEPKPNGTASIVATQLGLRTHELNLEAKATWSAIVGRFVDGM